MSDTDMMIMIVQNGQISLWDMWSTNHDAPVLDSSLSTCQNNLQLTSQSWKNGNATAVFTRKLDTGDKNCDFVIPLDTSIPICYAHLGKEQFDEHNVEGSGTAVFGSKKASSLVVSAGSSFDEDTHAKTLLVGWMCAAPLAVMVARYGKRFWLWYWIHAIFGTFAVLITYVEGILGFKKDTATASSLSSTNSTHFRLGMAISSLVFTQFLLGVTLKLWVIIDQPKIGPLRIARVVHMLLGWVLLILGLVVCYYGLDIYSSSDMWILYMAYAIIVVLFAVLEVNQRLIHFFPHKLYGRMRKTYQYEDFPYRGKQGLKVAFCDQWVLDIGGFISSHPGGAFILEKTATEDIGKYIVGNSGLGSIVPPYTHSKYARILVKQHRIGRIPFQEGILIGTTGPSNLTRMTWQLTTRIPEADNHIVRFSFQVRDHKAVFFAPGVEWMGKHYRVTAVIKGKKVHRYYSLVLCLTPRARNKWIASAQEAGVDIPSAPQTTGKRSGVECDEVELVVKRYENGVFSSFLHGLQAGAEIEARGPMGPGLRLDKRSTGRHIALAAGTGVLPFLDLVHFLWWKEINSPDYILDPSTLTDFSLHLILFLRTRSEAIGLELLESTHSLCRSSSRFTLTMCIDQPKPDNELLLSNQVGSGVRRVWICGPAGFNTWAEEVVLAAGVDRSSVYPF